MSTNANTHPCPPHYLSSRITTTTMQADNTPNANAPAIHRDLTHETNGFHGHGPCIHNCPGANCLRTHQCDIPNCSIEGTEVNEWRKLGGNWRNHIGAFTKHPNCTSSCPGNKEVKASKAKADKAKMEREMEREKKKKRAREEKVDVDMEGEEEKTEEGSQIGGTIVRKRSRLISTPSDDENDADKPAPVPSASASQTGVSMDVDVPDPADTAHPGVSINANTARVISNSRRDLRFKIVVVLNVNGRSDHRDITKSTTWMKMEIKTEEANQMLENAALANFIELCKPSNDDTELRKGYAAVMMYDRVSVSAITLAVH